MSRPIDFFKDLSNFIRVDIWRITEFELSRTKKLLYRLVKIIFLSIRDLIKEKLNIKASALTYSILFAMVPMIALIVAIGRGFGVEDLIEKSIRESFAAQGNMIPFVMNFVKRYLASTHNGLFIGVGLVILLISVINFFNHVELALNSIWRVKKKRPIINQLTLYISAMLIIPVLIVFASGLSIYVNTILKNTFIYTILSPVLKFMFNLAPYFIDWIIFSITYLVIPNTRVKFSNALIAGILAGSAFQLFQALYIKGQVLLSRYDVVYGSFAAIPLLLLWLQISFLIFLLGAEISYTLQNIQNFDYELDSKNISNRYKNFMTVFITHVVVKRFVDQQEPLSSYDIASKYKLPIRLVNEIIENLVDVKILNEIYNEGSRNKAYQPAIDVNQLTIGMVFDRLDSFGSEEFLTNNNVEIDSFWQRMLEINEKSELLTDQILVKDM